MRHLAPEKLSHKPIITVDYKNTDKIAGAGDAIFLSLGRSTWDKKDISAKVFRKSNNRWSRQSEELPLWRVLDLAILLVATINETQSSLAEFVQDQKSISDFRSTIANKMKTLAPKMNELRNLLNQDNT